MKDQQQSTFGQQVIDFYLNMDRNWRLPKGFELIDPFDSPNTVEVFSEFNTKYFNDNNHRHMLLGINPGRHGAGVTGIPFTDPKILENDCSIENPFPKKSELSALFVYDFIVAYGGIDVFYDKFYINSVCPLGFLTNGINCNYYDDKTLYKKVEKHIVSGIKEQLKMNIYTDVAFCLGNGKNYKFLSKINEKHTFFDKIIPLPHPRWVMQYRRKRKDEFISMYIEALTNLG